MTNPFKENCDAIENNFMNWKDIYPTSYDAQEVSPYTKLRIILMNGTEFEANWFMHQFSRHCNNNDLRREVALIRAQEQQQQKKLACLKSINESVLEHTIGYEHLAVDLTAILAKREPDANVKKALDFALLEDFDHLYRYADLLEFDKGIHAEKLVGGFAEIMPGRPTISEHRHPYDNIRKFTDFKKAEPITKLNIAIITAAEQQTMNYYMNVAGFYENDMGRKLYQEIAMIEEQHVSQYESLMDPNCTWLESLLEHEYTECYLYKSCYEDETDKHIKQIWEQHYLIELAHLKKAAELLKKYENKDWKEVIPDGKFPELLHFGENIDYVRHVIETTVYDTSVFENYMPVSELEENSRFCKFQNTVNTNIAQVPCHKVINQSIKENGEDYRYETEQHPIKELANRKKDNTSVGRCE